MELLNVKPLVKHFKFSLILRLYCFAGFCAGWTFCAKPSKTKSLKRVASLFIYCHSFGVGLDWR